MHSTKSEPKLQFSLTKFENYFTEKNLKGEIYMDEEQRKPDLSHRMKSHSTKSMIKPRAKLTYSLRQKVGTVLADSKKMGMIEKTQNSSTRRSIAKISYTSTLPPIQTETHETDEYLRKLKNELNTTSQRNIEMEREISTIEASRKQLRKKIELYEETLANKGEKSEEISRVADLIELEKYNNDVRRNMKDNLKSNLETLNYRKSVLQEKLRQIRSQCGSLGESLEGKKTKINSNIYTKEIYSKRQNKTSEQLIMKANVANVKLTLEHRAEKLHEQFESIQLYDQQQYQAQKNERNHKEGMNYIYAEQFVSKALSSLYLKYQLQFKEEDRAYALIKMYSMLNDRNYKTVSHEPQSPTLKMSQRSMLNPSTFPNKSLMNSNAELDIVDLYEQSFIRTRQLESRIREYEGTIKKLEQKNERLFKKWVMLEFEDSISNGDRLEKKRTDYGHDIKELYERDRRVEKSKQLMLECKYWVKKQQEKLDLRISKKGTAVDYLIKIMEYLREQVKSLDGPVAPSN